MRGVAAAATGEAGVYGCSRLTEEAGKHKEHLNQHRYYSGENFFVSDSFVENKTFFSGASEPNIC